MINQLKSFQEVKKKSSKTEKPKKEPRSKEDKYAIIAAIASAFVIVFVICFIGVAAIFPSVLPWNNQSKFEDGIVFVKLLGACEECSMLDVTLKDGIEELIKSEILEVKEVRNLSNN